MGQVIYREQFKQYEQLTIAQMKKGMSDIARDVKGAAKGAAPHFRGQLEKGIKYQTKASSAGIEIVLDASAKGSNGFDYAPYIHNSSYNLGTQSRAKAGGTSGISGKTFNVGTGFLARPVTEGAASYHKHLEKLFREVKV